MTSVYTKEQWDKDNDFLAEPGQEIEKAIYDSMLDVLPPKTLPNAKAEQALQDFGIPVHKGFLMGEPVKNSPDGQLYRAFGMNDFGKGKHCYYLGLSLSAKLLNGSFYFFDCLTAFPGGNLFHKEDFEDVSEAIQLAADCEATLLRYEYRNGMRTESKTLYEPRYF